jgi:hypothetical protein
MRGWTIYLQEDAMHGQICIVQEIELLVVFDVLVIFDFKISCVHMPHSHMPHNRYVYIPSLLGLHLIL